jgi:hypothetical protein
MERLTSAAQGLGAGMLAAGLAAAVLVGATAGIEALRLANEFADLGNKVQILHEQTGLSAGTLAAWKHSADVFGVSAEQATAAVDMLYARLEEGNVQAGNAMERLGLNLAVFKSLSADEKLGALAAALAKVGDEQERVAYLKELFGRGGAALMPAFTAEFQRFQQDVKETIPLTAEGAERARQWTEATKLLALEWQAVKQAIGQAVVAALTVTPPPEAQQAPRTVPVPLARTAGLPSAMRGPEDRPHFGEADYDKFVEQRVKAMGALEAARAKSLVGIQAEIAAIESEKRKTLDEIAASELSAKSKTALSSIYQQLAAQEEQNAVASHRRRAEAERAAELDRAQEGLAGDLTSLFGELTASERSLTEARAASLSPLDAEIQRIRDQAEASSLAVKHTAEAAAQKARILGESTAHIEEERAATLENIQATALELTFRAQQTAATQRSEQQAHDLAEAEQHLAQSRIKGTGSLRDQIAAIDGWLAKEQATVEAQVRRKEKTEAEAAALLRLRQADADAQRQHARWADLATTLQGVVQITGALTRAVESFGVSAESAFGRALGALEQFGEGAQNVVQGIASGNVAQAIAGGIQAVGSAVHLVEDLFGGPSKMEQQAAAVGQLLGRYVSDSLLEQIRQTSLQLNVDVKAASLLHLTDSIRESGMGVEAFAAQVDALMKGVAGGSIPARQGIEQIGSAFDEVRKQAAAGNAEAYRLMLTMIQTARATGEMVPEIAAAVRESLGKAAAGVEATAKSGIGDPRDQARVFMATFYGLVAQDGPAAAVKAMQPAYDAMVANLQKLHMPPDAIDAIMGPAKKLFDLAGNEATAGILDGLQGMQDSLKGLQDSGYLTADAFAAFQNQTKAAFDQLTASGVDSNTALAAIAPMLAQMQQAAAATGQALDPVTQALINQAQAAGISFPVDPMRQTVDLLTSIAKALGADIPASAQAAGQGMANGLGQGAAAAQQAASQTATAFQSTASSSTSALVAAASQGAAAFQTAASGTVSTTSEAFTLIQKSGEGMTDTLVSQAEYWSSQINSQIGEMPVFAEKATSGTIEVYQGFSDLVTDPNGPLGGARTAVDSIADAWRRVTGATNGASSAASQYPGSIPGTGGGSGPGGGARRQHEPDVTAASGFYSPSLPRDLLIQAHRGEEAHIGSPGSGNTRFGGSTRMVLRVVVAPRIEKIVGNADPKEIAAHVIRELEAYHPRLLKRIDERVKQMLARRR